MRVDAAEPPSPVQVSVKVEDTLIAGEVSVPDVGRVPVQAPEAVQAVAFCVDQVNEVVPPFVGRTGEADNVMMGSGGLLIALMARIPDFSVALGRAMTLKK